MPYTETGKEKQKREAYEKANKERGIRQDLDWLWVREASQWNVLVCRGYGPSPRLDAGALPAYGGSESGRWGTFSG